MVNNIFYRKFKILLIIAGMAIISGCGNKEDVNCDDDSSAPYVYSPAGESNGKNVVLHSGHGFWSCTMTRAAYIFADAGFTVYRAEMPAWPHDESDEFFKETNALLELLEGEKIYMVGLSGGGWTTTMATAMNEQIIKGYSVAGDHPVESYIIGDYEQQNPPLDYYDAYSIAGDRLLHIYGQYDSCCFAGITGDIGTEYVIDYTYSVHQISEWAATYILNDMLKN